MSGRGRTGGGWRCGQTGGKLDTSAGKVKERIGAHGVIAGAAANDTEAGVGSGRSGILENVPPGVDLTEGRGTSDFIVESLGVGNTGNGEVLSLTADGPSGLSNPDGLTTGGTGSRVIGSPEEVVSGFDAVGFGVLEEGVLVDTEPVNSLDDGVVGRVGPGIPGINVTDLDAAQGCSIQSLLDLSNVVDNLGGACTNARIVFDTGGRHTVQVFTADGETNHQIGKGRTILLDGGGEGIDLVGHAGLST